jgi:DHA1 family multidrug resistance protein-like MFS transporter
MPANHWQRTLYIVVIAQVLTAIGFSAFFPFLPLYVHDLGSSMGLSLDLLSGLAFSGQAFTMMLVSPMWGALADRYGRKLMVERAMFGGTLILLLMAFSRSAEELVLLRIIQGLITGTVAAANALIAAVAPRERMGYAMGMLEVGLGAGVAFGPLIGGAIADVWGYSAAFYVTSAMLLIGGILVLVGVKEDFHPPAAREKKKAPSMLGEYRRIIAAPGVSITYFLRFLSQFGRNMIVPVLPLLVQSLLRGSGAVNTVTGLVTGGGAAATTLSSVYLGRLGDRIGHRRILVICLLVAALLYFPQAASTQAWQVIALQALVGVAMGGVLPALSALLARYTRPGEEGAVYGLDNSVNSGGRAVAPLIGAAFAAWLGYRAAFTATGIAFLISGALAAFMLPREPEPPGNEQSLIGQERL